MGKLGLFTLLLVLTPLLASAQTPSPQDIDADNIDPMSQRTGQQVFSRIATALNPSSCTTAASQSTWMKHYIHDPRRFERQLQTMLPYLDHVSIEIQRRGLPMEYALIPFVESRYLPKAVAKGGPTGLWQLMPATAKHYGLKIGGKQDGRYSVVEATRAALDYLELIHGHFNHWQTGIMAYNAGDSRLRINLRRQNLQVADANAKLPKGLAPHTYAYVKKIQALSCFFMEPTRFDVRLPDEARFDPLVPGLVPDPSVPLDNGN